MKIRGNGKLLLTGEYVVLDGADALAIPTKWGQSLSVTELPHSSSPELHWIAKLADDTLWFECRFSLPNLEIVQTTDLEKAEVLHTLLLKGADLNPLFFSEMKSSLCETKLEFNKDWGLGSSSTLLHIIGEWAGVDAFTLLESSFKTSGYDVAIAAYDNPIIYKRVKGERTIKEVRFNPSFKEELAFVYLNQKQNTQTGVKAHYSSKPKNKALIDEISRITQLVVKTESLAEFERLLTEHEQLMASHLGLPTVKSRLFPEYGGLVKSLGTWGGDFVLITCHEEYQRYFQDRGYHLIIPFSEMIF